MRFSYRYDPFFVFLGIAQVLTGMVGLWFIGAHAFGVSLAFLAAGGGFNIGVHIERRRMLSTNKN